MFLEIIYSLFLSFILVFLLLKIKVDGLSRYDITFAFLIKGIASLIFIYIFTYYYGIGYLYFDSGVYISDAKILNEVFYKSPINYLKLLTGIGENTDIIHTHLNQTGIWSQPNSILKDDAKNVIRINSIIHFFSFGSIYIHFLVFNLLSLFGIVQLFLFFKSYIKFNNRIFFYILILTPSFLFWSSGVLKEPLVIFSYGIFFYFLRKEFKIRSLKYIFLIVSLFIIFNFKAYIFISLLFGLSFLFLAKYVLKKFNLPFILCIHIGLILIFSFCFKPVVNHFTKIVTEKQFDFNNITKGGIYIRNISDKYTYNIPISEYKNIQISGDSLVFIEKCHVFGMYRVAEKNIQKMTLPADTSKWYYIMSTWTKSNSYIEPSLILYSKKQLIKNIPISLVNSLLRPSWNDPGPKFKVLTIIETYLVFAFLILAFIKRRKLNRNEKILVITLLQFVIILSLFIGWTTPVFGAIVRYRIFTYLGIFLISFIIIKPFDQWKIKKNIS
ncbi:MAG: hypothetical protein ACK5B9_01255 [Flavobacteriia bacterium]|jgi:hypothetical protein